MTKYRLMAVVLTIAALAGPAATPSHATVSYVVNSTSDPGSGICDSGECTLRSAIDAANANPGPDSIIFEIGSGAQQIKVVSALPAITDPVTIDATTQPGFSGTPLIELNGNNASTAPADYGADGFLITTDSSIIRGFIITGFNRTGILISGASATGNIVEGNHIGSGSSGSTSQENGVGVGIKDAFANLIGGTDPSSRNVIGGNEYEQVRIHGGSGNVVQGNYLGLAADGLGSGGAFDGIRIKRSSNNLLGGTDPGAGNVISHNKYGIRINGHRNSIQGNLIGTDASGMFAAGNRAHGIQIAGAGNSVGGTDPGASNTIAYNEVAGIFLSSGKKNSFLSNSVFSNTSLGIDLAPAGVTANDALDGDLGANSLQNYPSLTSATEKEDSTIVVSGELESMPDSTFVIQLFSSESCDVSGFGEGMTFAGSTAALTDGVGFGAWSATLNSVPLGYSITATATDSRGNTSEYSACVAVASNS